MLDEDLSWLLGEAATGALPSRAGAISPRAARRRRARRWRVSGSCRNRSADLRSRCRRRGAGCARVSCGNEQARRTDRDGGRTRAHRRGPRTRLIGDAIDTAYRAASRIHFDGMQFRRDIGRKALRGRSREGHSDAVAAIPSAAASIRPISLGASKADRLRSRGAVRGAARSIAGSLVVVNTCSVTATADQGVAADDSSHRAR